MSELRVPRSRLLAAVAPEPLDAVLQTLVDAGILGGFRGHGSEVVVWGDIRALEIAIDAADLQEAQPDPAEPVLNGKGAYFSRCKEYIHTPSFQGLPQLNQNIWRLHAIGRSHRQISVQLGVTEMRVRTAVQGARMAARLPRTVQHIRRGSGGGQVSIAVCSEPGCGVRASHAQRRYLRQGLCPLHYQRKWRARELPEKEAK